MQKKIRTKLRNVFIAGLLAIVPIFITVSLFVFLLNKFDKIIYPALNKLLTSSGLAVPKGPPIPGLGFFVVIFLIMVTGSFTTGILGKKVVLFWEKIVAKIPFAGNIYTGAKQILEAITLDRSLFEQVVIIEYPRKGLLSIGFVTCDSPQEIQSISNKKMVNVFVPTTPNPTSGILVFLPEDDTVPMSISVEEGIKLVISGGIVSPDIYLKDKKRKNN